MEERVKLFMCEYGHIEELTNEINEWYSNQHDRNY